MSFPAAISEQPAASATTTTLSPTASIAALTTLLATRTETSDPVARSRSTMTLASASGRTVATTSSLPARSTPTLPSTIIPDAASEAWEAATDAARLSWASAGADASETATAVARVK